MDAEKVMDTIEIDLDGYTAAGENEDCITECFDLTGKAVE